MRVEVAYAGPGRQSVVTVELGTGATVRQAIETSRLLSGYPGIDLAVNPVGIYGERVALSRVLAEGERVEIYRPLVADPGEARKKKAARKKRTGYCGGMKPFVPVRY